MTRPNNNSNEKEPLKSSSNQVNVFKTKEEPSECYKVDSDTDDICELEHLRKLFIGGLAPHTTEDTLKAFYEQWGKVVDVVVMRDASGKRSRGFGFITYAKAFMVDCAQEARPHVLDGKTVEAKRVLPRPEREKRDTNISVKKLFVGGLKHNHDDECLKEYFSQFGKVISVKILTDKATGKRRGFAFIAFDDYDAVDKAVLQKIHSIRNVMVDVKKSVYNLEHRNASANAGPNMPGPPLPGYGQQYGPGVPPYNGPPMNFGPPPPNYNYWNQGAPQGLPVPQGPPVHLGPTAPPGPSAPPGPPAPYYGGYQQPPQQPPMSNWNYPPLPPNNWNAGPPPPPGPQLPPANWQPQWCPPPAGAPTSAAQTPNWNPTPPAAPQTGQPPAAPQNIQPPAAPQNGHPPTAGPQLVPPQVPPTNFGSGYQQNYGGGPSKNNNMNVNRMNPYGTQPYGGYGVVPNTAPLNNGNVGRNPVPPGPFGNRRY